MKNFVYEDEKVFTVKFTTTYGTFEFDLDFVEEVQENTVKLLKQLREEE